MGPGPADRLLQRVARCGIFRAGLNGPVCCFPDMGRRSSVVEHVLGKDGVECSIHFGGTIFDAGVSSRWM
jgi:hypothetical protein